VAAEPAPAPSFQPAFVAVQSTVLQEHDPARPNDNEDYHKDKLRRTKKAKLCKELEWPAASERSPPSSSCRSSAIESIRPTLIDLYRQTSSIPKVRRIPLPRYLN
jgi:hypothetical protein